MVKRTDRWLKKWFDTYNELYHGKGIPSSVKVRFGVVRGDSDAHFDPVTNDIVINRELMGHDSMCLICLHHEMSHAYLYLIEGYIGSPKNEDPDHGMRFQADLERKYKMGAYDGLL